MSGYSHDNPDAGAWESAPTGQAKVPAHRRPPTMTDAQAALVQARRRYNGAVAYAQMAKTASSAASVGEALKVLRAAEERFYALEEARSDDRLRDVPRDEEDAE
jgi:hypothetical protein